MNEVYKSFYNQVKEILKMDETANKKQEKIALLVGLTDDLVKNMPQTAPQPRRDALMQNMGSYPSTLQTPLRMPQTAPQSENSSSSMSQTSASSSSLPPTPPMGSPMAGASVITDIVNGVMDMKRKANKKGK